MYYFLSGFELIMTKGLKRFVFIPFMINLCLFSLAIYSLLARVDSITSWANSLLPDWLSWLSFALTPFLLLCVGIAFLFLFTTLANFIAAPFNGILSEKIEKLLTGQAIDDDASLFEEVNRSLIREWQKLKYFIPRLAFFLVFLFVPVVGQILWFLWAAWMMAIQYCDYPYDNHKVSFEDMKTSLLQHKFKSLSFGASVIICSMVPILNFFVMPVAVCGATKMWVEKLK